MQTSIAVWPRTRLGWWAVGLMVVFVVMFSVNVLMLTISPFATWWMDTLLPYYGVGMVVCVWCGAITAIVAWRRAHDHALTVGASMLPLFGVVIFIIGELVLPH